MDAILASDWGEDATINGVAVKVIFETVNDSMLDGMAESSSPAVLVKADVQVREGDSVVLNSVPYKALSIETVFDDLKRVYLSKDNRVSI